MSLFPGAIASFLGFTSGDTLKNDQHGAQHNSEQAEIVAAQTKIGTGASTPTSGLVLRGNGVGTSAWAQVNQATDVTGVLPQANGGTGTTLATGTGKAVYDTAPTISGASLTSSPTLTTPTITSFVNANHNHQNAAGGGQLSAAAISSLDLTNTTLLNPYKFSVYRNAAWTSGNGAYAKVPFDTKIFDTGSNFDAVTNNRFTAPIAGFYQFNASVAATVNTGNFAITVLYKNGVFLRAGGQIVTAGNNNHRMTVSSLEQLSANDYIEVFFFGTGGAGDTGTGNVWFNGFLVSTT